MSKPYANKITSPTLLIQKSRALKNIKKMAAKATVSGIVFRPHFKTHQSPEIGMWFKKFGVDKITVSSIEMAETFAKAGWTDITIAFPVNILEISRINKLAKTIRLHLILDSKYVLKALANQLKHQVFLWIEIDTDARRSGVSWRHVDDIAALARSAKRCPKIELEGLLTHSGQSYLARSNAEIKEVYLDTVNKMINLQERLLAKSLPRPKLSIGDTPCCSVNDAFVGIDEIRPGNFLFYDIMQLQITSCAEEEIAMGVACPIVAKNEERTELVIHGGAIHLSKDQIEWNGSPCFGRVAWATQDGWGPLLKDTYVRSVSQEHGVIQTTESQFKKTQIGDILVVIPVHSCLTMSQMQQVLVLK